MFQKFTEWLKGETKKPEPASKEASLNAVLAEHSRLVTAARRQNLIIENVAKNGLADPDPERSPD